MMKPNLKWRPSRGQLIFFGTVGSVLGLKRYDTVEANRLREEQKRKAIKVAEQPMAITDKPRFLRVFIASTSADTGSQYTKAFEQYVKPVWDAAALDYEVVEGWEWYEDTRNRAAKFANEQYAEMKPWNEKKQSRFDQEGGDGFVALGRPAYKAVLSGLQDFMQNIPEYSSVKMHSHDILDDVESNNDISKESNETVKPVRKSWWRWWGSSNNNNTSNNAAKEQTSTIASTSNVDVDNPPLPPVGFIPFNPQGFWMRVLNWFRTRHKVATIGDAALAIALGKTIPMDSTFPGNIIFTVEQQEFKEPAADKPKVESNENNESNTLPPVTDHQKLISVGDQVLISEITLGHLKLYQKVEEEQDEYNYH